MDEGIQHRPLKFNAKEQMIRLLKRAYWFLGRQRIFEEWRFNRLLNKFNLQLDYKVCKDSMRILEDIFVRNEYAQGFPFGQEATVLDLGAHYGFFSLWANQNLDANSKIYAVEPSTNNFKLLKNHLHRNNAGNVICLNEAVSSCETIQYLQAENHSANYHLISEKLDMSESVNCLSLSSLVQKNDISKIEFLKMDVEGSEYEIILNTPKATFDIIETISLEFHDRRKEQLTIETLKIHLESYGFKAKDITYKEDRSGARLLSGNAVFVRT